MWKRHEDQLRPRSSALPKTVTPIEVTPTDIASKNLPNMDSVAPPPNTIPLVPTAASKLGTNHEQELRTASIPVPDINPSTPAQETVTPRKVISSPAQENVTPRKVTTQMKDITPRKDITPWKDIAPRRNPPRNRQLPIRFRKD